MLVGGCAYDAYGTPLDRRDLAKALASDAVLFGSVGGPKWEKLPFELRPERGLLRLRKEMDLFANLRPAVVFEALVDASSLKRELVARSRSDDRARIDRRHLFRRAARDRDRSRRQRRGVNTQVYTERRNRARRPRRLRTGAKAPRPRVRGRQGQCHGIGRAVARGGAASCATPIIPMSTLSFMYADNCAMQLVRNPKQFDVIVTSNLFGDILSDCAAMLTGSLGMLPSASLGRRRRERPSPRALRAGAWQRPRHRRQGCGQPARLDPLLRDDAALLVRPAPRRPISSRTRCAARSTPGCEPTTSLQPGAAGVSTTAWATRSCASSKSGVAGTAHAGAASGVIPTSRTREEAMQTRNLGRTGIEVSVLGFGCGAVGGLMVRGRPGRPGAGGGARPRARHHLFRHRGDVRQRRIGAQSRPRAEEPEARAHPRHQGAGSGRRAPPYRRRRHRLAGGEPAAAAARPGRSVPAAQPHHARRQRKRSDAGDRARRGRAGLRAAARTGQDPVLRHHRGRRHRGAPPGGRRPRLRHRAGQLQPAQSERRGRGRAGVSGA